MAALPSDSSSRENPPLTTRCTLPMWRKVVSWIRLTKYNTDDDKIALIVEFKTKDNTVFKVDVDNFTKPARKEFEKSAEYNAICDALSISNLDLLFQWASGMWYFDFVDLTFHRYGTDELLDAAKIAPIQDACLEYATDGLQAVVLEFYVSKFHNGSKTTIALKPKTKQMFVPSAKLFGVAKVPLKPVLEAVHMSVPSEDKDFDEWMESVERVDFTDAYMKKKFEVLSYTQLFENGDDINTTTVYSKVPVAPKKKKGNESRRFAFEFRKEDPSTAQWTLCGEMLLHLKDSIETAATIHMDDTDIVMAEKKPDADDSKIDKDKFVDGMFDVTEHNANELLRLGIIEEVPLEFDSTVATGSRAPIPDEIKALSESFGMLSPSLTPPPHVGTGRRGRGRHGRGRRRSRVFVESPIKEMDIDIPPVLDSTTTTFTTAVTTTSAPATDGIDGFLSTVNGFERMLVGIAHFKQLNPQKSFGCGRIAKAIGLETNQRQTVGLAVKLAASLRLYDFQFAEYRGKRMVELLRDFFGKDATLASRARFGRGGEYPTVGDFGMKPWTTSLKYTAAEVAKWSRKRKSKAKK